MKQVTANFKVDHKQAKRIDGVYKNVDSVVYGKVTFKNGKLSISIQDRNYIGQVSIVESKVRKEFENYSTSEIFSNIVEVSDTLVSDLRIATQELKNDYIAKVIESATEMHQDAVAAFESVKQKKNDLYKQYMANYGNYELRYECNKIDKQYNRIKPIAAMSLEAYIKSEVKHGELHYESSLLKLANRLISKGISENFKIKSGYVGMNFEVVITHDKGQVKAWTIIACGPIVRPHYRYLVK